ncbi:NAD-binding protein [Desulfurococcaceae archaeon MEX13E-LK6-19]|nr:NAD-binding protein [Desulfurococcaceae archaeon MEX13E-LK6-19]
MAAVIVFYRLKKIMRVFSRRKSLIVIAFFITTFLLNGVLFYYAENIVGGRKEITLPIALYWSLITMATIGYGDITPKTGPGYFVASIAAIMGIAVYTLTISIIADAFLSSTLKKVLGLGKLRGKKILVVGDASSCKEIISELIRNNLEDYTGWVMSKTPKTPPPIDYIVGEYDEDTLKRAGIEKASHIVLCLDDDSKTLHLALLIRKLNKKALVTAVVLSDNTGDLLKEAGVDYVLTEGIIGRLAASSVFEPLVVSFIRDVTTAKGYADLIEYDISDKEEGLTIRELEEKLFKKDGSRYKVLYMTRNGQQFFLPPENTVLKTGDKLVLLKAYKHKVE